MPHKPLTIVTHKNPHLDEITCIWLVKRFLPQWETCGVRYIPTNPSGGKVVSPDSDPRTMFIGVGRGKFDEHKGNLKESATTLVYAHIFREKKITLEPIKRDALRELVTFVNDEDHGLHITLPFSEFMFSTANAFMPKTGHSSKRILDAGLAYLDGVYAALIEKHTLMRDWKKSFRLETPWGTAIAIATTVSPKTVLRRSAQEGIQIAVVTNPVTGFKSVRAVPESTADFTQAFITVHEREPHAEWYLHHSKKMLICGSDVASNKILSRMSLTTLASTIAV